MCSVLVLKLIEGGVCCFSWRSGALGGYPESFAPRCASLCACLWQPAGVNPQQQSAVCRVHATAYTLPVIEGETPPSLFHLAASSGRGQRDGGGGVEGERDGVMGVCVHACETECTQLCGCVSVWRMSV